MRDRVVDIIRAAAVELNDQLEYPVELKRGEEAPLFGVDAPLDSLALASLVIAVEQALEEAFQCPISLADEHAMSRSRSAFRTIGSLADYAVEAMAREAANG